MCLVRLLNLLQLNKVNQRSFAEYHSKRNFVERVHAAENVALSRHGAFCSSKVHQNVEKHSPEHLENMESMAKDVKQCLSCARFGNSFIQCFRGVAKNVVFNDELKLKEYLNLNEERKMDCDWTYTPLKNEYFNTLVETWKLDENYIGQYAEDYKIIANQSGVRTANKDKYGTMLRDASHFDDHNGKTLQPIPDYIRWVHSGELHFLSYEKTEQLARDKPEITDCDIFLPTRILDIFFHIENDPSNEILQQLALLSWLPIEEVTEYFNKNREKADKSCRDNIGRETWRSHPLYKLNMAELEQMCKRNNVSFKGPKYVIVKALALAQDEDVPDDFRADYKGDLGSLPKSISMLKKLPAATLQYILKYHNLSAAGKKDNLVLRVFLLRNGRSHLASYMQVREIKDLIKWVQSLILYQVNCEIIDQPDIYRTRKFPGKNLAKKSQIPIPYGVSKENLENLFETLLIYLNHKTHHSSNMNKVENTMENKTGSKEVNYEDYFEVGSNVKIRWTSEEIGDSGWKPGWYSADVQSSTIENDEISVVYVSEPDCVYSVEVTPLLALGKLRM